MSRRRAVMAASRGMMSNSATTKFLIVSILVIIRRARKTRKTRKICKDCIDQDNTTMKKSKTSHPSRNRVSPRKMLVKALKLAKGDTTKGADIGFTHNCKTISIVNTMRKAISVYSNASLTFSDSVTKSNVATPITVI